jgi:hypothetical protein
MPPAAALGYGDLGGDRGHSVRISTARSLLPRRLPPRARDPGNAGLPRGDSGGMGCTGDGDRGRLGKWLPKPGRDGVRSSPHPHCCPIRYIVCVGGGGAMDGQVGANHPTTIMATTTVAANATA